jgi:hypothetical protein
MEDETGFPYYKFLSWGDTFAPVEDDLLRSNAIREAKLSGSAKPFADSSWQGTCETYKLAKEGKSGSLGPYSLRVCRSFSTVYDKYRESELLLDAYNGLPTDS